MALAFSNSAGSSAVETSSPLNVLITPREFAEAGNVSLMFADQGPIDVQAWCPPGPVETNNSSRVCSLRTTLIVDLPDRRANVIPWALHVHEHATSSAARSSLFFPDERSFVPSITPFSVSVDSGSVTSQRMPTFLDSEWAKGSAVTVAKTRNAYQVTATCRTRSRAPKQVRRATECANNLVQAQLGRIDKPVELRGAPLGDVHDVFLPPEAIQTFEVGEPQVDRSRLCRVIEEDRRLAAASPLAIRCQFSSMGFTYRRGTTIYVNSITVQAASSAARARVLRNSWSSTIGGSRVASQAGTDSVQFTRTSGSSVWVEIVKSKGSVVISAACEGLDASRKAVGSCAENALDAQIDLLSKI